MSRFSSGCCPSNGNASTMSGMRRPASKTPIPCKDNDVYACVCSVHWWCASIHPFTPIYLDLLNDNAAIDVNDLAARRAVVSGMVGSSVTQA